MPRKTISKKTSKNKKIRKEMSVDTATRISPLMMVCTLLYLFIGIVSIALSLAISLLPIELIFYSPKGASQFVFIPNDFVIDSGELRSHMFGKEWVPVHQEESEGINQEEETQKKKLLTKK